MEKKKKKKKEELKIYNPQSIKSLFKTIDYEFVKVPLPVPPRKKKTTDVSRELNLLYMELAKNTKKKKNSDSGSGRSYVRKQLCTVKMFYGNDISKHKDFLRNYMPQKDKKEVVEKPLLFNGEKENLTEEDILEYEKTMAKRFFKFIISPDKQNVPIKNLVREYIKQLEELTGYKFYWTAVEHTNTGHRHAHVLINGIDRNGKEIKFDRDLVKSTARKIACSICTNLIGERTEEDIKIAKDNLPLLYRYIPEIDDKILKNLIAVPGSEDGLTMLYLNGDSVFKKRIETLKKIGLASYSGKIGVYILEKNWDKKLKAIGRYNTFLDARKELLYVAKTNLELYSQESGKIRGIVTKRIVKDDEQVWSNAIVVENKALKKAWYIPLRFVPDVKLKNATVEITPKQNQHGRLSPNIIRIN